MLQTKSSFVTNPDALAVNLLRETKQPFVVLEYNTNLMVYFENQVLSIDSIVESIKNLKDVANACKLKEVDGHLVMQVVLSNPHIAGISFDSEIVEKKVLEFF